MIKQIILSAVISTACAAGALATDLRLDFGSATSPVTGGYTPVVANFLADTANATAANINGTAYTFSIAHVGAFSFGNVANSLTTDGFYTFGNETNDHTFTLSGLSPGAEVYLYAVAAWDGNGRGAQVTFGGVTTLAQTVGTPGSSPTLANFTQINSVAAIANGSGLVTGSIKGHDFPGNPATEGQVGGFVFSIVPEPSAFASLIGGAGLLLGYRRRKVRA